MSLNLKVMYSEVSQGEAQWVTQLKGKIQMGDVTLTKVRYSICVALKVGYRGCYP